MMDHLKDNIGNISRSGGGGYPIFGALSYFVLEPDLQSGTIVTMFAGAIRGGENMPIVNPAGKAAAYPVDHFQLAAFGETLRLGHSLAYLRDIMKNFSRRVEQQVKSQFEEHAAGDAALLEKLSAHHGANYTFFIAITRSSEDQSGPIATGQIPAEDESFNVAGVATD
jgi:hypothetical protein